MSFLIPDSWHLTPQSSGVAVLASGGLDSAVLIDDFLKHGWRVRPLYIRAGLYWEAAEMKHLRKFVTAIEQPHLKPLVVLRMPADDLYGRHWSLTGKNVPDAASADEAVFLPGRNILLLAKALLWCRLNQVAILALAPLKANPFADATDDFFQKMELLVNQATPPLPSETQAKVGGVRIVRPYSRLNKREVLARGMGLPLQWTFSCIHPERGRHCGRCNKCAERRKAFAEAGIPDPTEYAAKIAD